MTEADILKAFARANTPALETLGGSVLAYDDAKQKLTMKCVAKTVHCHSVEGHPRGGVVQGGFVTGWLDAAMAHACIAHSRFSVMVPSLEIKVSFLLAAHPGIYRAEGWIVRWGRNIAFLESELQDEAGAIIARASSTVMLRHIKKD